MITIPAIPGAGANAVRAKQQKRNAHNRTKNITPAETVPHISWSQPMRPALGLELNAAARALGSSNVYRYDLSMACPKESINTATADPPRVIRNKTQAKATNNCAVVL